MEIKYAFRKSILVIIFIFLASCDNHPELEPTPTNSQIKLGEQDLVFLISTQKDTYRLDEDIPISMELTNQGFYPLLIYKRLFPAPKHFIGREYSVFFSIDGPSGEVNHNSVQINALYPVADHFVALYSGERFIWDKFLINRSYDFSETGMYTIEATYRNVNDHPDGRETWIGLIVSNTISIEIVP